jgi:hypothetical protein
MTNMMPAAEQVLKSDSKGRVHTPPERRESLLDEFERSGLSGKKFTALVGVKYQTFATWAKKRREQRGLVGSVAAKPKPADSVRWLEAMVEKSAPSTQSHHVLVVHLPGQARMEINGADQAKLAAVLLGALAGKPSLSC